MRFLVLPLILCGLAGSAYAESQLVLPMPSSFEALAATTFDKDGQAVGLSSFDVSTEQTGMHRMTIQMGIDGGGLNKSEATLAIVASALTGVPSAQPTLRLVEERSQATRADGVSLDLLVIDHVAGRASCYPPDGDLTRGKHIDLPKEDRVLNVPMQLLFQPLAKGEVDNVEFQIVLCRNGPVLHEMIAVRGDRSKHDGREVVEIRYGPDLGTAISWLASRLLPRFSFWFDENNGAYLGHRMPLHTKGPEILLVRQGLTPRDIGVD